MKWLVMVLLAALVASSRADTCVNNAAADLAMAADAKVNEASYAAALKKLKVVRIATKRTGVDPRDEATLRVEVDKVVTRGNERTVFAAFVASCGGDAIEDLVQRGNTVYRVVRKAKPIGRTIKVCGCAKGHGGCGGAAVTWRAMFYVLPDTVKYGGPIEVTYTTRVTSFEFGAGGTPCPLPTTKPASRATR